MASVMPPFCSKAVSIRWPSPSIRLQIGPADSRIYRRRVLCFSDAAVFESNFALGPWRCRGLVTSRYPILAWSSTRTREMR